MALVLMDTFLYLEEFKKVIQFSFKLSIVEISKIFFSTLSLSVILISQKSKTSLKEKGPFFLKKTP